jgi:hypothetical protein
MNSYHQQLDFELSSLGREIATAGDRAEAHLARTGPPVGTASSRDNTISVTVSPGGTPQDIRIDNAALNLGPDALAEELVRLAGLATGQADSRMHQSLRPMLDARTASGLARLGMPEAGPARRSSDEDDPDGEYRSVLGRR